MLGEPGWKAGPDPAKTPLSRAAGSALAEAVLFKARETAKKPGCRRIEAVRVGSSHRRQSVVVAAVAIAQPGAVVEAVPGAVVEPVVAAEVEAVAVVAAGSVIGRFYERGFVNDSPGAKATLTHPGLMEV
jgi:hypothetical protein